MKNSNRTMRFGERGFFALADFYGGGGQALIGVIYFFFLTNVIGLEPILAGAVTVISEVWDAISDPIMGVISDRTKTHMGRRRPYILIGGSLIAVAFALVFMPIGFDNQVFKFIYCAVTYLFYNTVSTMVNVSYSSMSAEISNNSSERDGANVLRLVVSTASTAICTLVPSLVMESYEKGAINITTLYIIFGVVFGILFAIPVVLCAIFVRERVESDEEKRSFSLREIVMPLKNRSFRQLLGMYLGQALCMDVFSAGVIMFAKYVTNPKGSSTIFLAIFIVVQLLAFPIVNVLIKRFNVNKIYSFGLPLAILALVCFALFGSNLYAAYASVFFIALGFAGAQLTSWIMFPHTVDAGELLTGKRQSGSYSATMTFARKSSTALVIYIFSVVLQFTGYDELLEVQPVSAQNGIKYAMAVTCIIFMVFGFIMAKRYVLSRAKNRKIEEFLMKTRNGEADMLTDEEFAELEALKKSIS